MRAKKLRVGEGRGLLKKKKNGSVWLDKNQNIRDVLMQEENADDQPSIE